MTIGFHLIQKMISLAPSHQVTRPLGHGTDSRLSLRKGEGGLGDGGLDAQLSQLSPATSGHPHPIITQGHCTQVLGHYVSPVADNSCFLECST